MLLGAYVEIGVYKGGSAFTALEYMRRSAISRPVVLMDTFEGFNYEEAAQSAEGLWNGTHKLFSEPDNWMTYLSKEVLEPRGVPFLLERGNIIRDELPLAANRIAAAHIGNNNDNNNNNANNSDQQNDNDNDNKNNNNDNV